MSTGRQQSHFMFNEVHNGQVALFSNVKVWLIQFMPYLQSNLYWPSIKSERPSASTIKKNLATPRQNFNDQFLIKILAIILQT